MSIVLFFPALGLIISRAFFTASVHMNFSCSVFVMATYSLGSDLPSTLILNAYCKLYKSTMAAIRGKAVASGWSLLDFLSLTQLLQLRLLHRDKI